MMNTVCILGRRVCFHHPSTRILVLIQHSPGNALSSLPSPLPSPAMEFYTNPEKQIQIIPERKKEVFTEDQEIWELIKRIANQTSLDSPRLFGPAGVGKPLTGDFPATIHPREHRWIPMSSSHLDESMQRRLEANAIKTTTIAFLANLRHNEYNRAGFYVWMKQLTMKHRRKDQRYNPERVRVLGPELAVAHFLVARGGAVKFHGVDRWYSKKEGNAKALPGRLVEQARLEAIDASGMDLIYEGLENFVGLRYLKSLKLRSCPFIDDWCLPKLFGLHKTLEHLDLSGCPKITHRGLSSLYHLRNLRTLTIDNLPRAEDKEYIALLLEDELPFCEMIGVEYNKSPEVIQIEKEQAEESLWEKRGIPNPFRIALPGFVEVGNRKYAESIHGDLEKELKEIKFEMTGNKRLKQF